MQRKALVQLLVRGAAALETPGDLNADEKGHVIDDLRQNAEYFEKGMTIKEPEKEPRTLKALAQEAIDVQNACNPMGISKSYAAALLELSQRLRLDKLDASTDAMCCHPIARMWACKVHDIHGMGLSNTDRFSDAYIACKDLAGVA